MNVNISENLLKIDFDCFKGIISDSFKILEHVFQDELVISDFPSFRKQIFEIFEVVGLDGGGSITDYTKYLNENGKSGLWSVSICSVDGQQLSFGDYTVPFTMQGIFQHNSICLRQKYY